MTKLLVAKTIIDVETPKLSQKAKNLENNGLKPKLSVILVGNNPASLIYVKNKKSFCKKIGVDFELIQLPEDISENDFRHKISNLNNDTKTTGCFVQLPIPEHLKHIDVTQLIHPDKDVDGFHLNAVNNIYFNKKSGLIPCTPKGIMTLFAKNKIELKGKNVVIIGRSYIVGRPLSLMLNNSDATVSLCHHKTTNLFQYTKMADIIISATGVPGLITKEHLNPELNPIIVDVGISKVNGKTVGDVDFEAVKGIASAITPVPGGVGPMTVFSLMENILMATENILRKSNEHS